MTENIKCMWSNEDKCMYSFLQKEVSVDEFYTNYCPHCLKAKQLNEFKKMNRNIDKIIELVIR